MKKKMLMILSDGFEEIEAAAPADILIRAGVEVKMTGIGKNMMVKGAHGISYLMDGLLDSEISDKDAEKYASSYSGVILPGGQPNASTLRDDERVNKIVHAFYVNNKIVSAICASPCVLEKLGILKGRRATSYPGCVDAASCGEYTNERAVRDGNIITGRSAGTALDFGFEILKALGLEEKAEEVRKSMLY